MVFLQRFYKAKTDKKQIIQSLVFPFIMILFIKTLSYIGIESSLDNQVMYNHYLQVHLVWISIDQIINDREKYNNVFKLMGLSPLAYWLGNFLLDCMLLVPLSLEFIIFEELQGFIGWDEILKALATQAITIMSLVIMCYNCSRLLSSSYVFVFVMIPLYFIGKIPIYNFKLAEESVWGATALFCIPHLFLYPGFLLVAGFLPPLVVILSHFAWIVYKDSQDSNPSNEEIVQNILPRFARPEYNPYAYQEKMRLMDPRNQDAVKIVQGYRFYPDGWRALWDLNFGVEKGQIFCLLGPNGAGKTSTFDIITRKGSITSGKVYINGQEVIKGVKPVYNTGFCLQVDFLWDDLTVEQHFRLYSCLKGLNNKEANESIEYVTKALGMKKYLEKKVKALSGGSKRKLSVALAIIGAPEIIVLDEPTTGVDAIGRSQIWKLLKILAEKKKSTVMISTHYMEDAELVADKLGILVNGSLMNMGNITDIRRTYQEHYLTVNGISEGFVESLMATIKKIMPEALLDPSSDDKRLIFKVPSMVVKFSNICLELESLSADKKITDFSINVKTLEQAFLGFAHQQIKKPTL